MSVLRKIFGLAPRVNHHELLSNGAILVDVRTPAEFNQGSVQGAKNVPLDTIERKVKKFKQLNKPVVLCCRSGMRSGQATAILKKHGVQEVYNGGSWLKYRQ